MQSAAASRTVEITADGVSLEQVAVLARNWFVDHLGARAIAPLKH
jgi:hypothetical protein